MEFFRVGSKRLWGSAPRRSFRPALHVCCQCYRQLGSGSKRFQVGDYVLIKEVNDATHEGFLLRLGGRPTMSTHRGKVSFEDIIGARPRDVISTSTGRRYRLFEPTLAEYVLRSPRVVTPIYPSDANLIVSLLDIHVSPPSGEVLEDEGPLEILEAGTGNGSLTLHLSRAIHAANTVPPPHAVRSNPSTSQNPADSMSTYSSASEKSPDEASSSAQPSAEADAAAEAYTHWKRTRRAVIHTIDVVPKHSRHAEKVVRGFRGGMYLGNVDFHVGDAATWIEAEMQRRASSTAFLSHAFLDMPDARDRLETVSRALRIDGCLAVFNPSVTQIADCVETVRKERLPLLLEQVLELGASGSLRQWDVRAVKPRVAARDTGAKAVAAEGEGGSESGVESAGKGVGEQLGQVEYDAKDEGWKLVCKPKVGDRIVVGGFLGIWKKMADPRSS
ncbi:S-adenosyl-L-methionine-dependent methyltransferase [Lineolata rhizophorae]|uniref:tRNA (adenine(58)-N(1))-methyltransferase catalytic subunit TRM61 n=1 Tax=Lineolata rhizophorae TaxID=578093 RepID=A0A6A6PBR5_9PEZI|nr:S-adenosyl-L-methionine-dependent methyltransferase [Lineolata rhizophorae]